MEKEKTTDWQVNIEKEIAELRKRVEELEKKSTEQSQPLTWQ